MYEYYLTGLPYMFCILVIIALLLLLLFIRDLLSLAFFSSAQLQNLANLSSCWLDFSFGLPFDTWKYAQAAHTVP